MSVPSRVATQALPAPSRAIVALSHPDLPNMDDIEARAVIDTAQGLVHMAIMESNAKTWESLFVQRKGEEAPDPEKTMADLDELLNILNGPK